MRTTLSLLLVGVLAGLVTAQGTTDEKFQAKLAKSFAKKVDWELDFAKAKEKAKAEKKLIMGYFTRSYAP